MKGRRSAWHAGVAALLIATSTIAGCSTASPRTTSPSREPSRSPDVAAATPSRIDAPCPTPLPSPVPEASLPAGADEATRKAVRVRREFGLRRDLAWIRQVAADPTATSEFGTPLLPEESASLFARNELSPPVKRALDRYGHVDEYGGMYTDHELGGVVVVLWAADLAEVQAVVRSGLPSCYPVEFRRVRWPEQELRQWQDRISADSDWVSSIPARVTGIGANVTENVVEVDVSSAVTDAAQQIVAHYAAPEGMVRVISDGTGVYLLPGGTVSGRVVLSDGSPPGVNNLMLDAGSSDDPPGWCGGGDIGYGVMADGHFEYPCIVGRRTILVRGLSDGGAENGGWEVLASTVVDVPANGTVEVEIRLPLGVDPAAGS
jgi:hypothetical protein